MGSAHPTRSEDLLTIADRVAAAGVPPTPMEEINAAQRNTGQAYRTYGQNALAMAMGEIEVVRRSFGDHHGF